MGLDSRSQVSFTDKSMGKNAIIFGAGISSSVHICNKKSISQFLVKDQHKDYMILH